MSAVPEKMARLNTGELPSQPLVPTLGGSVGTKTVGASLSPGTLAQSTVSDIFDCRDALSKQEFDPVDCINMIFPTEQSLSTIDKALAKLRAKMNQVGREIRDLIRLQTDAGTTTIRELEDIRAAIQALFSRVKDIKDKAHSAEAMVLDVTQTIKMLDTAKKNLLQSSVFVERFQMLYILTDLLKQNCNDRQYLACSELLPAVQLLVDYFEPFSKSYQVVHLVDSAKLLYLNLKRSILGDFDASFAAPANLEGTIVQLNAACKVSELLEKELGLKTQIVQWYCDLQLREYRTLFIQCAEESGLEQVARRYSWLKRILKNFDSLEHSIFPEGWCLSLVLCAQFCDDTRRNLSDILKKLGSAVDIKMLMQAYLVTQEFESKLEKRFATVPQAKRKSFVRAITGAMDPALGYYLEAENATLSKAFADYQNRIPLRDFDENLMVMTSSADMFYAYRQLLMQVSRFSSGQVWLDLCSMLQKWLTVYAVILVDKYPLRDSAFYQQFNTIAIMGSLNSSVTSAPSNLNANLNPKSCLTESEVKSVVLIMNTADYCYETTVQLVEKLKEKALEDQRNSINFEKELEMFFRVREAGQRILQRATENAVDPCFLNMLKVLWGNLKSVGDTSDYIAGISGVFNQITVLVKSLSREEHWESYFDYVEQATQSIFVRFYNTMFRCRPLSEVGAEQMLLDLHSLRTAIVATIQQQSPKASEITAANNHAVAAATAPTASRSRTANAILRTISKQIITVEAVLKMVMKRLDPTEAFVMSFKHLFGGDLGVSGESPSTPKHDLATGNHAINAVHNASLFSAFNVGTLLRILDLKGARRVDTNAVVELFTQIYGEIPGALENNVAHLLSSSSVGSTALHSLTNEVDDFSNGKMGGNRHIKEPSINGEKIKRFMAMSVNGLKSGANALNSSQSHNK